MAFREQFNGMEIQNKMDWMKMLL